MAIQTEQLNDNDRHLIEKKRKKDILIMVLVIAIGWLTGKILYDDIITTEVRVTQTIIQDAGILILVILFLQKFFRRFRKGGLDLVQGMKKVCTGPVEKIMGGSQARKAIFSIDGEKITVPVKAWRQYRDGDVLRVEYAPQSKYILSIIKKPHE